jgi:hypothetical protein
MMVQFLNDPKFNLRDKFIPNLGGVKKSIWIFDKLVKKNIPKLASYLVYFI